MENFQQLEEKFKREQEFIYFCLEVIDNELNKESYEYSNRKYS